MKIRELELIKLSCFFEKEWRWPGGRFPGFHAVLVRVLTDSNIEGIGEIGCGVQVPDIVTSVFNHFKPLLIGREIQNIQSITESLYSNALPWGRRGVAISVISGIDIALHDVLAKSLGIPMYVLLGGQEKPKIKAYASGGVIGGENLEALQTELHNYVQEGFKAVKIRIGYGLNKDLDIVQAARDAIGDGIDLMLDAGQNYRKKPWDLLTAKKVAKALEPFNPFWLEEPLRTDNLSIYQELRESTSVPIAGGESGMWRYEFRDIIDRKAMDIIQPDPIQAGGLRETKLICDYAAMSGVPVAPHIWGSAVGLMASLSLIASTPSCIIAELSQMPNPFRDELLVEKLKLKEGHIVLPDTSGLGVEVTEEHVRKYPFNPEATPVTFNK